MASASHTNLLTYEIPTARHGGRDLIHGVLLTSISKVGCCLVILEIVEVSERRPRLALFDDKESDQV
jgi:hypothetical protein